MDVNFHVRVCHFALESSGLNFKVQESVYDFELSCNQKSCAR